MFRSAQMDGLTSDDAAYVAQLGLGVICDLRSAQERQAQPNPLAAGSGAPFLRAVDYDYATLPTLDGAPGSRAEAIAGFAKAYAGYTQFLAPQFSQLFEALATSDGAVAFNCTLGKDRTGVAAALVLSVLGVPRSTIVADYARTQTYAPPAPQLSAQAPRDARAAVLTEEAQRVAALPHEVYQVLFGSEPAVMRQALALIDRRYGGPLTLARTRMGLTETKIAHLRRRLLV